MDALLVYIVSLSNRYRLDAGMSDFGASVMVLLCIDQIGLWMPGSFNDTFKRVVEHFGKYTNLLS